MASNSTELVNETFQELNFRYAQAMIPFLCYNGIICIVGIVGNILIIVVYSKGKDYKQSNFKVFAIALAAIDFLSCFSIIPIEIMKSRTYYDYPSDFLCKSKCAFQIFSMTAAALTLLVICIDRYRVTCKQFQYQMRKKLAFSIICLVIALSAILSIPAGVFCGTTDSVKTNLQGSNITVHICLYEPRYKRNILRLVYKYFMSFVLVVVSIAFIVMYIFIMKSIYHKWRRPGLGGSIRMDELVRTTSSVSTESKKSGQDQQLEDDVFRETDKENNVHNIAVGAKTKRQNSQHKPPNSRKKTIRSQISNLSTGSSTFSWIFRHRRSSTPPGKVSRKTIIWFILTLIFLTTYIIYAVLSFASSVQMLSPVMMCVFQIFSRLHYINNCINVFVYASLDQKFLPHFRELFGKPTVRKT